MASITQFRKIVAWCALGGFVVAAAAAQERDLWPAWVGGTGTRTWWTAAGPLVFGEPTPDGGRVSGFRPAYLKWTKPGGRTDETAILYPLFVYRRSADVRTWSVFQLVNCTVTTKPRASAGAKQPKEFALWPFYLSRRSRDPAESYRALFPIAGTVKDQLYYRRVSFVLFPLYLRTEKRGETTTSTPWPFIRVTRGAEHGFALWPFYAADDRPGEFSRRSYLWPFVWTGVTEAGPGAPPGTPPSRSLCVLPFYASVRGPGLVSRDFMWPFFGYTDHSGLRPYRETRYFWPFLVQGRGPGRLHERWGPFYTHSNVDGLDKVWAPWPLFRRMRWREGRLLMSKTQVLYWIYWKGEERKASDPAAAPAYTVHYWPFLSVWDNGAGRREWQALSPFSVFFPNNRETRAGWAPLFALARHRVDSDGSTRTSLLWNAVTWRRDAPAGTSEFHLGPLLSVRRAASGRRTWRVFGLEFSGGSATIGRTARRP
ncbi:MAG: hypothetical protein ACREFX_13395 [Opitutaceae bacterium]